MSGYSARMVYLKCTGEVQKALGLRKDQLAEPQTVAAPLGSWYVHRFSVGRTRFFLFMSEVSLLSFLLFQGGKPVNVQTLPPMFMAGLSQLLSMKGVDAVRIENAIASYHTGLFSKTDSRTKLGSMNDLVRCYTTMIESQGGLDSCDLTAIIMKINEMPQRVLGWKTSWDVTFAALASDSGAVH